VETIRITPTDNRYTVREKLRRVAEKQVLLAMDWDIQTGWKLLLDYELLFRAAVARALQVAWACDDPERVPLMRAVGFPVFSTETAALTHLTGAGTFPPLRGTSAAPRPGQPWWAEDPQPIPLRSRRRQPLWLIFLEVCVLLLVLTAVAGAGALTIPTAQIVLRPSGLTYSRVVAVSVDPALTAVDLQRRVIPARRIGDEFQAFVEVSTTGRGFSYSGHAHGSVLFTNLLGQDYRVPEGTAVRTTAGSYPVRFLTLQEVVIPAYGQVEAPIKALDEGPAGNVEAYQINLVEGVAGFAVRVTNPYPTGGAESSTVPLVAEADQERAYQLAQQRVMAEAYTGLQDPVYLKPGELLPHQALVVQAIPKAAYSHLVGEGTTTLGLTLRLLVTGQAVKASDIQAVAYRQLATQLPAGYTLTDARFEYGEAAEEDVGPGWFTFYVKAYGYAAAGIDTEQVLAQVKGKPITAAIADLQQTLSLAQPPEISITPAWFPYLPILPIHITVKVTPEGW